MSSKSQTKYKPCLLRDDNRGRQETEIGEIPEDWAVVPASNYCARVTDGTHDSPKQQPTGRYLITSRHITGGGIDLAKAYKISESDYQEINRRSRVDQWDILFSMIGTVGEVVLVTEAPDFAIKNIGLFKNKGEIEAKWLFYYLRSPLATNYIKSHSSGSTQQYLTLDLLRRFPVVTSPRIDQLNILKILSSLDDKIELNRKMNKTLEEIGKALFKRWFVDFEFPYDQGKPYKSSGGEMVNSELGEIPKGWKVQNMGEELEFVYGKALREGERSEGRYPVYGSSGIVGRHNEFLVKAPGIVVGRKGNVGSVYWVDYDFYPIDTTYYVKTNQSMHFVLFALQRCNLTNSDSAVPGLSRSQAYMNSWLSPEKRIISKYDEVIKVIFDQKKILNLS